jgi:hypothetical protein
LIKINKNHTEVPGALNSNVTEKWIELSLKEKNKHVARQHVYADDTVKKSLKQIYNNKCGYCESILELTSPLTIEHYRPKKSIKENSNHPGYYWLSYEWTNLISICNFCNTRKSNFFPLTDENNRINQPQNNKAEWKANSLSFLSESPLLLHPEIDNPDEHLEVNINGLLKEKDNSMRGRRTIEICYLNRDKLIIERKKIINKFRIQFNEVATSIKKDYDNNQISSDNYLDEIKKRFSSVFNSFSETMIQKTEYSIVGKNMFFKFDIFFIQTIKDGDQRDILKAAFKLFYSTEGKA